MREHVIGDVGAKYYSLRFLPGHPASPPIYRSGAPFFPESHKVLLLTLTAQLHHPRQIVVSHARDPLAGRRVGSALYFVQKDSGTGTSADERDRVTKDVRLALLDERLAVSS
jgi:hypothetical protein